MRANELFDAVELRLDDDDTELEAEDGEESALSELESNEGAIGFSASELRRNAGKSSSRDSSVLMSLRNLKERRRRPEKDQREAHPS